MKKWNNLSIVPTARKFIITTTTKTKQKCNEINKQKMIKNETKHTHTQLRNSK